MAVLHAEYQIVLSLEAEQKLSDEGVAAAQLQNLSLVLHYIFLLVLQNEGFADDLHRHQFSKASCQVHFGEAASSEAFHDFQCAQISIIFLYPYAAGQKFYSFGTDFSHFALVEREEMFDTQIFAAEIK